MRIARSTPCRAASASSFASSRAPSAAAPSIPATRLRTSAVASTNIVRLSASPATRPRRSARRRSGRPGATIRGASKIATSPALPSPASPAANHTGIESAAPAFGSLTRISRRSASGVTGVCQAFGPSRLPMWPIVLKVQSADCQGSIKAAIAWASPGPPFRHAARAASSGREGAGSTSAATSAARYFGLTPCFAAASSRVTVPANKPSRSASAAARHATSGGRPPALVSKAIPWRLTLVAPVFTVLRA